MTKTSTSAAPTRSHFIRNLLIVFLCALLVLGIVLGAISIVRDQRTYARHSGTIADRAIYSYLLSYYKFNHMRVLAGMDGAEDTEAFWSSVDEKSGKTQGELLAEGAKNYVTRVLISASLFDSAATAAQKREAKAAAKQAAEEILTYRADGDIEAFNEITAPFGYAYEDLEGIALLLYKAENAQALFYGIGGENAKSRLSECNLYMKENYSAVHLLFIRTENTFSTTEDEDGNITIDTDENGANVTRPLRTDESLKREETMQLLDAAISAGTLTKSYFEGKMKEHYGAYPEGSATLFYFADGTDYTEGFRQSMGEPILSAAEELAIGACKKIAYEHGYCYVYKCNTEDYAFSKEDYEHCFSDFYENVANHLFTEDVAVFADDVVFKKRAATVAITALPYKNLIHVRF